MGMRYFEHARYRVNILRTIAIEGVVRTVDVDEMDYVSR